MTSSSRRLVVIPTFNEALNIERLLAKLLDLKGPLFDILIVDDSSPDGTSAIVSASAAENTRVRLLSRPFKSGIGGAHRDGILYGYRHGYTSVATMDADLTHAPEDLLRMFDASDRADVVVASRFLSPGSLPGWQLWRLALTHAGHLMTRTCLGIPYDATGALRVYNIAKIPQRIFTLAQSTGYSFIFETLLLLHVNGFYVHEIPVILPGRILGSSKMSFAEIRRSVSQLLEYLLIRTFLPERLRVVDPKTLAASEAESDIGWDEYWGRRPSRIALVYDVLAGFYRRWIIRPPFERTIRRSFHAGAKLLHAGCGSGQVDMRLVGDYRITALDYSKRALELYLATNGAISDVRHGSILALPFSDNSFDGIYNLGVMEHFPEDQLRAALREFKRVLKSDGTLLMWWPAEFSSTVFLLGGLNRLVRLIKGKRAASLFPAECSRVKSKADTKALLEDCGFKVVAFEFGLKDLCTQVVIKAIPTHARAA